ncbi:uncharacterized protein LOC105847149 [Hydra vulgaris]|uniref:Uncharacterized protein LOC105847149 n=1 Tax=Hydra vulgaris TaxID=6087 RepID=A0ABM4BQR2_HYDVU
MAAATSCNDTHNITSLSMFSLSFSSLLCVGTVTTNALLITAILGDKRKVFKRAVFYKLLLNITIADLLTGAVNDASAVSFHFKEANKKYISYYEVLLVHLGLFMFCNVSFISMALLCVDRIIALIRPIVYRNGLSNQTCNLILISTWFLSLLLLLPYFSMGYVKYLSVFLFTSVSVTFIALILMIYLYKTRFVISCNLKKLSLTSDERKKTNETFTKVNQITKESQFKKTSKLKSQDEKFYDKEKYILYKIGQFNPNFIFNQKNDKQVTNQNNIIFNFNQVNLKSYSAEQRVNQSFIIMLFVFFITYFPACGVTLYLNLCGLCNCTLTHVLRDFTYLSLLSSALWRSINFACRITTLKKRINEIITHVKRIKRPTKST